LDPYKAKIDALIEKYPRLSAVRVLEEIRQGPAGYDGQITLVRDYLRKIRPRCRRVYREVLWEPGQALQVDWGSCGSLQIGQARRKVSVLVAVLCYSRLCYLEFTLSQRKAEFYRAIVHALEFFGGSPRQIIFDNLKAAVLNGSGRTASLHPEFLALCGYYCLEPVACARRDPESKGMVEATVRYVKRNALEGRDEQLTRWEDYLCLATSWRDEVANVRRHQLLGARPVDRFEQERPLLRALPAMPYDTDEVLTVPVDSHARVKFDGNRYSLPPKAARQTAILRADGQKICILYGGQEVACHQRCYDRGQLIRDKRHEAAAVRSGRRERAHQVEARFDALGEVARQFHRELRKRPVKTLVHLRRIFKLVQVYGTEDVLASLTRAVEYRTYDAAYVEMILLQERRRRDLPSPTGLCPERQELIDDFDLEEPDPSDYDRFCDHENDEERPDE
jgi:transposase